MTSFASTALRACVPLLFLSACSGSAAPASPQASSPAPAASASAASAAAAAGQKPAASSAKPAASAGSPAASAEPAKLVVAYGNITGTAIPLWIAADTGIFKKHGVDVDLELVKQGQSSVAAMVAGEAQIAMQGGPEVVNVASQNVDVVVVEVGTPVYPYKLYVPADIKTPADLKGKTVDYGALGGATGLATAAAFRRMGLSQSDVKVATLGTQINGTAALLNGQTQARMTNLPDAGVLEKAGFHALIDLAAEKAPSANLAAAVLRPWLNSHRSAVQQFVDATIEATVAAHKNRQQTVDIMKKYFKLDDDQVLQASYEFWVNEVLQTLPYPAVDQFKDAVELAPENRERLQSVDLNKIIDRSFVQSAADRGLDKQ
jgi:NitT/TauT family transport system substrate-binding protein